MQSYAKIIDDIKYYKKNIYEMFFIFLVAIPISNIFLYLLIESRKNPHWTSSDWVESIFLNLIMGGIFVSGFFVNMSSVWSLKNK